ncbi:LOW QUALITY PROTEIN: phosphoinositide 3-kinase regulatory subunit 6 [Rhinatrema bivittatum]|uniref:LOW QUALITY PROTEIN: phosphoinositide 3-kinase regulatory subunit 6 n=1 Tax=Rhinatrema bivittatum TaxID=194408 RepID=UPI001127374E|nr:LOW QUALITY PROTEIN: phosphoinositide 3-kinase regulatory subunit 6 [Rhinatrema bivittatum]
MDSKEIELDVLRSVQAILRELDGHHPGSQCDRGMRRWTLHKKIDRNPISCDILIKILVKELEKAERGDNKHYIIPLLHTLMYTLIKAPYISDDLYERVYDFCKKLLTLPKPYCIIGFDYAMKLKNERMVPGVLYQRMVISEQSLTSKMYPYQESKVFVFLDPDLISESVSNALLYEAHSALAQQTPAACLSYVIAHSIQAALRENCDIQRLQKTLQDKPIDVLENCFQEVVAAVEFTGEEPNAERSIHAERLKKIYDQLICPSAQGATSLNGLQSIPLPNPRINFYLWTDDDLIRKELFLFTRPASQSSEESDSFNDQTRISVVSTDSGIEGDLPPGSEELPSSGSEKQGPKLQRKPCIKKKFPAISSAALAPNTCEASTAKNSGALHRKFGLVTKNASNQKKLYTARVVVLGDDRVLGRLAKAYYSLRKSEARRPLLTLKANLQFYCIPVLDMQLHSLPTNEHTTPRRMEHCEVSMYLGKVDPWYESNINTLCHMIPKLATMPSSPSKQLASDPFITDVTSYYVRMGVQPVCFQIYSVKIHIGGFTQDPVEDVFLIELKANIQDHVLPKEATLTRKKMNVESPGTDILINYKKTFLSSREKDMNTLLHCSSLVMKAIPADETEDLVCLNVNITEVTRTTNLSGRSFSMDTNTIRTSSIKIQIRNLEYKAFTVCLDKDSRRVYNNVVGLEVSPCLEPGYCLQKLKVRQLNPDVQEDVGLTKYMSKSLLLPINTFAGIVQ